MGRDGHHPIPRLETRRGFGADRRHHTAHRITHDRRVDGLFVHIPAQHFGATTNEADLVLHQYIARATFRDGGFLQNDIATRSIRPSNNITASILKMSIRGCFAVPSALNRLRKPCAALHCIDESSRFACFVRLAHGFLARFRASKRILKQLLTIRHTQGAICQWQSDWLARQMGGITGQAHFQGSLAITPG